jgi:hypothetical protein
MPTNLVTLYIRRLFAVSQGTLFGSIDRFFQQLVGDER